MIPEDSNKEKWLKVKELLKRETSANNHQHITLGEYYTGALFKDIRHLLISWSRYKFISKLFRFDTNQSVLELGCNEGLGALFFTQNNENSKYLGVDFDTNAIVWAKYNLENDKVKFCEDNFLGKEYGKFDIVLSVDVIEHLEEEDSFVKTICENLNKKGVAVIGTPNITMSPYASKESKEGHINLYSQQRLWDLCKKYFQNVFIFNMTDEVMHTGFDQMSCYMFAVCVNSSYMRG